jgi:hypothetical protein
MSELIEIEEVKVLAAFSEDGGLDPIINDVKDLVSNFEHDMKNATSRARTASFSYKISQLKTKFDDMGKKLVSGWKEKAKVVDKSRKTMRDTFDELRDEARLPLSEWEAEDARKTQEKAEQEAAEKLQAEIESDYELAVLMDEKVDRDAKEEADRAEADRQVVIEEEKKIKAAQEQAEKEAAEKAEADRIEQQEKFDQEQAENEKRHAEELRLQKIANEERGKVRAEQAAIDKIRFEQDAKDLANQAAEISRLAEVKRQEDERLAQIQAKEKREANNRHVSSIRRTAKERIVGLGVDEETAKKIVLAIDQGAIPNVHIDY